ncbi:MAG: HEAT repeat domain-containing protein [Gemmataceae bacterium]|nr:HEAT repeat domain-containing protein [Gemmataceae bacterium]
MPFVWRYFAGMITLLCTLSVLSTVSANPEPPKSNYNPPLAKASDQAEKAIPKFKRASNLNISVWAAEPMLAQPVAFCFDEKGRCYVAETFRHSRGTTDNRSHMNWLDDEIALRTVEERVALYKKDAGKNFSRIYETQRERIRFLEDTKGKGRADRSTVFADDFGKAEDGLGAGLLARNGEVYFTCIPHLWKLKDTKSTGYADVKESLSQGYGVHTAFIGHDLHGLRIGPDRRLYFSLGDRGMNVKTKEGKTLFYPDTGTVMRCELDGSQLEVFAFGLRNPQELAFDDFGNLFTVDNNSDSGDRARFVHIVYGGDSGWRIGYQYGSGFHDATVKQQNRGPWNYEKLWHPQNPDQPAYLLPPLLNFADGPSGFTHYPGIGLDDKYKGYFFLCDFRGSSNGSGIWAFTTKPKGASFEMVNPHQFVWNILATDCDFGPDSALYISDWVEGWDLNGKGRIYKVTDPKAAENPAVAEAKKILAQGFDKRSIAELLGLLKHPHRDVRQEAHFALADKGNEAITALADYLKTETQMIPRVHAIWALGIMGRQNPKALEPLYLLLNNTELEIRANAIRALGDSPSSDPEKMVPLLGDKEPRVRMMTALALAQLPKTKAEKTAQKILEAAKTLLSENADKDPYLRHAGVMLLAQHIDSEKLLALKSEGSESVRLATVVALRRQKHLGVAQFLNDASQRVVAESARAIIDESLLDVYPALAGKLGQKDVPITVQYRAASAHFVLGQPQNAKSLAKFAADPSQPLAVRTLAVKMLGEWLNPPRRDYINGLTQSLKPRSVESIRGEVVAQLQPLFAQESLWKELCPTVSRLGITEAIPELTKIILDEKALVFARTEAIKAVDSLKDPNLSKTMRTALTSKEDRVRAAARGVLLKSDPIGVIQDFTQVLDNGALVEKQTALSLLGSIDRPEAVELLEKWLKNLQEKKAPNEIALDILMAASLSKSPRIAQRLKEYEANRPKGDDLANYRETLYGGDKARGREIFLNKAEVQCARCHKLDGVGGEVGPIMNGVAKDKTREYLLESIVLPNKQIAKGYESLTVTTLSGKTITGVIKGEDKKELRLIDAELKLHVIPIDEIDTRKAAKSGMPEDIVTKLSKLDIRDLVEFLASLTEPPPQKK